MTPAQRRLVKEAAPPAAAREAKAAGRFAFVGETWSEFKKVVWPTQKETIRLTAIVLAITVSLGLILGAIDLGFTRIVSLVGGAR